MTGQPIDQRLSLIETQLAYIDLCSRYVFGVDAKERDAFLQCWTHDAEWNLGEAWGNYAGKDAIAQCWENLQGAFHEMHHGTANYQILEDGGDRGVGRCTAFVPGTDGAGVANAASASYVDSFVRGDGGLWRFTKRDITVHYLVPWTNPQSIEPSSRRYVMSAASQ
jgi:ketosteroid isomerase-like protein